MFRSLAIFSILASVAAAQGQAGAPDASAPQSAQSQPAPIVRAYRQYRPGGQQDRIVDMQPISGVWLRSLSSNVVKTVSSTQQKLEVALDHGRLNVDVHHPADHAEILVDLPGGQTSLLKDGLYTFNADTNTVRVLRGEAAAYVGPVTANTNAKPIKVKEDHQFALVAGDVKPVEAYPYELNADLLPPGGREGEGYTGYGDYPPYPYGYYAGEWGYPYYPYAYPYFYPGYYGYPFAYGVGFAYYGGFHGGYRGGFRR